MHSSSGTIIKYSAHKYSRYILNINIGTYTWSGLGSWTLYLDTLSNNWSWSRFSCSHSTTFPCSQICARILQNSGSMSYSSFMLSVVSLLTVPSIRTCLVWGKLSDVRSNHKNNMEAWGFSAYTHNCKLHIGTLELNYTISNTN